MTTSTHFARVITSFMMLCIATSAFAQNRPNLSKDSGQPVGAEKLESIAKCPVEPKEPRRKDTRPLGSYRMGTGGPIS